MQPVVDPAQSLELIKASASFVVLFHLAPWKNDDRAAEVNWPQFCAERRCFSENWASRIQSSDELEVGLSVDRLVKIREVLLHVSYGPDDSDRDVWTYIGKNQDPDPGLRVKNHRAHRLLERLDRDIAYMSEIYLRELDKAIGKE
jgi:hypothetical protein